MRKKPTNAKWLAKTKIDAHDQRIDYPMDPPGTPHELAEVEVAWYDRDRIKVTLPHGAPAVIRQAYLTGPGADVIIELAPRDPPE
jgi:hypothetical protein